jgi:hypothetical protein
VDGVGSSAWQCKHACFNEKFFLTMLTNNSLSAAHFANVNSHLMPNKWAGDRSDLSNLIKEKGLHFHTLSHAQYATMVLVHSIAAEQRANKIAVGQGPRRVLRIWWELGALTWQGKTTLCFTLRQCVVLTWMWTRIIIRITYTAQQARRLPRRRRLCGARGILTLCFLSTP